MNHHNLSLIFAPLIVLTACSDEAAPEESAGGTQEGDASGSVLGGTISDDMIPIEQLQSQSPSAAQDPEGAGSGSASESGPARSSEPSSDDDDAAETDNPQEAAVETAEEVGPLAEPVSAQPAAPSPAEGSPSVAPPLGDGG